MPGHTFGAPGAEANPSAAAAPSGAEFPASGEQAPGLRPPSPEGALGIKPGETAGGTTTPPLANAPAPEPVREKAVKAEKGLASWYGARFHQRRTASGERFDMHAMTAAHPTLAFGTLICVRSQVTGRAVVVRVNDRGPHARGRIVDLSRAAAVELGLHGLGLKPVAVTPLAQGESACPEEKPRSAVRR